MKPSETPILFDLGNVLAYFDYARSFERIGECGAITGRALKDELTGRGLADLQGRYERGELSTAQFLSAFQAMLPFPVPIERIASAWSEIFRLNEPVAELVHRLADRGYPLILASNTNELHLRHLKTQFGDLLARFRHLIVSFEVHTMKPGPAFFAAGVKAAGQPAPACIFIDDVRDYVQGARAAGLRAIHFQDSEQLTRELTQFGVNAV